MTKLFGTKENATGRYSLSYLTPGRVFLSELKVFSNGMNFTGQGLTPVQSPPPFNRGYLECEYQVVRSTNFPNSITFPAEAVMKFYAPLPEGKTVDALQEYLRLHLVVNQISLVATDVGAGAPEHLYALDFRNPHLGSEKALNYVVTNDQWVSIDDPELQYLARMTVHNERVRQGSSKVRLIIGLVAVFLMLFPGWYAIRRSGGFKTNTTT